jgi:hypothetical protein
MDPLCMTKSGFDSFRINECDAETSVIHWKISRPDTETKAVESWNQRIKLNAKDFALFKDEAFCTHRKEHFIVIVAAQGLSHLIDMDHIVTKEELDKIQRAWLSNALQVVYVESYL